MYTFHIKIMTHPQTHYIPHTHIHTRTHTLYIPKSQLSSDTSSKDLFTVTALRRAAVTEGGMTLKRLPLTVSFCSVVHFERPASTADGRGTTCKEDGVTCMSCDTKYHKWIRGSNNSHRSVGECVVCVHFPHKYSSRDTACKEVTCLNHNMHV